MIEYELIDSDRKLSEYRKRLLASRVGKLAIDFEGEFNLHEYGERLCLIQVYDGTSFALIDPFPLSTDALKAFLEDKSTIKLFYGAESDRSLVYKQYGIKMKGVWDQKYLVDTLGLAEKSLDKVLGSILSVTVEKKKQFQMYNWTRRPLPVDVLQYALSDVAHLFRLNEELLNMVVAEGKTAELIGTLLLSECDYDKPSVPGIFKSIEFKLLDELAKKRCRAIFDLREAIAKEINKPPGMVLAKEGVIAIAKNPELMHNIQSNKMLSPALAERLRREIQNYCNQE